MRQAASEKLAIIWLVKGSHPLGRITLAKLGIPQTISYRWCTRYLDCNICILLTKLTAFEEDMEAVKKALQPQESAPLHFHPNLAKLYERLVHELGALLNKPDFKQKAGTDLR